MANDCGCGDCDFCRHYAADAGFRAYMDARPAKLARRATEAGTTNPPAPAPRPPCRWLGEPTGQFVTCPTCSGSVKLRLFACAVFGETLPTRKVDGTASCVDCLRHEPPP